MTKKRDAISFPSPGRKGDRTRLKIARAAVSCLVRQGGTRLTFEAVAQEVGMNRAQVRYHFPEISQLILEASKLVANDSQAFAITHFTSARTAREQIEHYIEAAFHSSCKVPGQIPVLVHSYERALHEKEFQSLYEIISDAGNERLAALLTELLAPFSPRPAHVIQLAALVRALLTGMVLDMHLRRRKDQVKAYIAEAKTAALTLITLPIRD